MFKWNNKHKYLKYNNDIIEFILKIKNFIMNNLL